MLTQLRARALPIAVRRHLKFIVERMSHVRDDEVVSAMNHLRKRCVEGLSLRISRFELCPSYTSHFDSPTDDNNLSICPVRRSDGFIAQICRTTCPPPSLVASQQRFCCSEASAWRERSSKIHSSRNFPFRTIHLIKIVSHLRSSFRASSSYLTRVTG